MAKSDKDPSEAGAPRQQPSGAAASPFNMARLRSDVSTEADSEGAPSSPHFYSTSVRQNSPSVDSYSTDTDDVGSTDEHNDRVTQADAATDQQLEQEAVKLDLLRRGHAQRAKETLEQLQSSSAPGSQAEDTPRRRSAEGISSSLVREQSQQLRQASEDLKRLAVEQRSSAEDAVADFLFQVQQLPCLQLLLSRELTQCALLFVSSQESTHGSWQAILVSQSCC